MTDYAPLTEEQIARIDAIDQEAFQEITREEIIEQFQEFSPEPIEVEELEEEQARFITAVHSMAESGDHFLSVFPGALSAREAALEIYLENPAWFVEPDYLYIEEIKVVRVA